MQRGDSKAVGRLRKLAENVDRFSHSRAHKLWNGLAVAAAQADDLPQAKLFYQRIAEKDPYNVPSRYRLLEQALDYQEPC